MRPVRSADSVQLALEHSNAATSSSGDNRLGEVPGILLRVVDFHGIQAVPGVAATDGVEQILVRGDTSLVPPDVQRGDGWPVGGFRVENIALFYSHLAVPAPDAVDFVVESTNAWKYNTN